MDIEILEGLALGEDRAAALAQLLPGSEDHDYYRALAAQHAGRLDEVDGILAAWPDRHGQTERYQRIRMRQMILRVDADKLRDELGAQHWHEAEVAGEDPRRPTKLAPGSFDGPRLLAEAAARGTDLAQVTDEGLYELFGSVDGNRRRILLGRINHAPHPMLVHLVSDELAAKGSGAFGSLRIHAQLTLAQLQQVAEMRPEVRTHDGWVSAVIARMRPHGSVDLEHDRDARAAYLGEVWAFVQTLPAATSLKSHVLALLLDVQRQRGQVDLQLFATYVQLPRRAAYQGRWIERIRDDQIARPLGDAPTGLQPPDDESLVRDILHANLQVAEQLGQWFERAWLDVEIASARLLAGTGDADKATLQLGPSRAAALRERVDLAWCAHNPTRVGVDDPIVLEADVKNVPELVVKVFRIDPIAYFQHHKREVNTDIDLDGLAPSHEIVHRYAEPPIRRVRRRIELPMCARPGTYVIDLIGNGMSSRAVIRKGRLRHVARIGAQGHVVTVVDEVGRPKPGARAWVGDREYVAGDDGGFVVPFSTAPAAVPMLVTLSDVASVRQLELQGETYELALALSIDRSALAADRSARAVARIRLRVAGAPVSVAALERASWDVTLIDRHGVSATKTQPLELADGDAAVLDWPMGEDIARVSITVKGFVRVVSEQREQQLVETVEAEVAGIHATTATEALYLARTSTGWVVSALGKSGEPRARRPVTIGLVHRWTYVQKNVELSTDDRGRVELGALPGCTRIVATLGASTQTWELGDPEMSANALCVAQGSELVLPIAPDRNAQDVIDRMSIVEVRAGAPMRHVELLHSASLRDAARSGEAGPCAVEPLEAGIAIRGLTVGDYWVRAPGVGHLAIAVVAGPQVGGGIVDPGAVFELSRPLPVIAKIAGNVVELRGATQATRVHVVASRFAPAPLLSPWLGRVRAAAVRPDRQRLALYVSGRELGDEYRYVLERRNAKRFPGLLVDRPSLLLNPWARRVTSTDTQSARGGGAFAASPPMQRSMGYAGSAPRPEPTMAGEAAAYASYDFLATAPVLAANLVPVDGVVTLPDLGDATYATLVVDDPAGASLRGLALPETPLAPRDLRLIVALDPARHATQQKKIMALRAGESVSIDDLATAKVHLVDTIERAHAYLLALQDDSTLREFGWVARWHRLDDADRADKYSKNACHELHLFLYFKDRPFFDRVVRGYLANKRVKTFVDHWLLDADLAPYLEAAALARLNAFELALLARRLPAAAEVARMLGDRVAVLPPDPGRDARLIDTLIGGAALEPDSEIAEAKADAFAEAERSVTRMTMVAGRAAPPSPGPMAAAAPMPAGRPHTVSRARMAKKVVANESAMMDMDAGELGGDFEAREEQAPMYRAADKTQEWAEHNWWHRTPAQSGPDMISPSRLWRDVANGITLSPDLGLAATSFAEAMCALAVTDLPFEATPHGYAPEGPRLTITASGNALVGLSQIVDGELVTGGPPLVVGQSYVRTDDRHAWVDGEQVDKYVTGPLAAGVVYTCQVVIANPTSSRQRVSALVQIPRGSIAVNHGRRTHTIDVRLEPYGTHGHEYAFYFPATGAWSHFPVHVGRGGEIVAAAPAVSLDVIAGGAPPDPKSWPELSQRGTLADVTTALATINLATIDLDRIAWRMKDRPAYDAIVAALEARRAFHLTLWAYALLHRDAPRIRAWLRALGSRLLVAGPVLDGVIDAEELGAYEHLELAPLVNARAHRLGAKLRILNDGLAAQYRRFLDLVSHRARPTDEDLLAFASYLFAQDRTEAALASLARVGTVTDRMQHDYLAAYAACITGDVARARALVTPWRELPVDRWRRRFEAMIALLDDAPAMIDKDSRDQQHVELSSKQPTFDLAVDKDGVAIRHQHVASLELRYFEMDVELLFSRQPFVQSDVSRFSYIEPGHRELLAEPPAEHRIAWPAALRGKNVVVEAVGAGQRKAKVHYANDLATTLAHNYGQIRAQRASDRAALPATYVKVYARKRGGQVAFYKDGYTDLRGWFDYATLSTTDLDHVERFAILVCSDASGAAILEADPPQR